MLNTLKRWSTPTAVIAASYFVLDHLLPDMIKIPHWMALALVALAGIFFVAAHAVGWWRTLRARVPGPWFPTRAWRVAHWLRRRPSVQILLIAASNSTDGNVLEECRIKLTLWRNLANTIDPTVIRFDGATLAMRNLRSNGGRRFLFRPLESGGLLALPMPAGKSDSVIVDFALVSLPMRVDEAPDFAADYELELTGVTADMGSARHLTGVLAVASYGFSAEAFRLNNNPVLATQF